MTVKKATRVTRPAPPLKLADKEKVLSARNIRIRHPEFTLLHDHWKGSSERDVYAYVSVGDRLYAVPSQVLSSHSDGELRVFLSDCPVTFDITDAFEDVSALGDTVETPMKLRKLIGSRCAEARQAVVNYWVAELRGGRRPSRLTALMAKLAPVSTPAKYGGNGIDNAVIRAMCYDSLSAEAHMIRSLMTRESVSLPSWIGTPDVECHVYELSAVETRRWCVLGRNMKDRPYVGARLRLDRGPLAIVTARSIAARDACEELIKAKHYGDVALLVGEGDTLEHDAERLSDYLLGVDILDM